MKKILLILTCFLLASSSWGAVAFDAMSEGELSDGTSNPVTVAHTTSATDRTLMIVIVAWRNGSGITNVTNSGTSLTQLRQDDGDSGLSHSELWFIVGPPSGTHDVVVSVGDVVARAVIVITYTGVDMENPLPVNAGDNTDNSPVDVVITTMFDNSWIVAGGSTQNHRTMTELTDYTERGDVTMTADWAGGYGLERGPIIMGTYTPGWTHSAGAIDNTISAAEVKEFVSETNRMKSRSRTR